MGKARSNRRSGIVSELRRRADWLRSQLPERDAGPTAHSMRAELDALERAATFIEGSALPSHPIPDAELTPAQRDEWRQLASWDPARQVALLVDVLRRLADESHEHSEHVAEALAGAHHAQRVAGARA